MRPLSTLPLMFELYVALVAGSVLFSMWRYLPSRRFMIASAIFGAWLAYAGALGALGAVRGPLLGIPGVFVLLAPIIAFAGLVLVRSPVGKSVALAVPLPLLVGLQTFRVGVELTIHKLWELGAVPSLLTLKGGNVDILFGVSAPIIAWISSKGRLGRRITAIWTLVGMLSLFNVATRSMLTAPGPLQLIASEVPNTGMGFFPFSYIPGFMAPLAIMLHILALKRLAASARSDRNTASPERLATLQSR